jgi:hypothetical protein
MVQDVQDSVLVVSGADSLVSSIPLHLPSHLGRLSGGICPSPRTLESRTRRMYLMAISATYREKMIVGKVNKFLFKKPDG